MQCMECLNDRDQVALKKMKKFKPDQIESLFRDDGIKSSVGKSKLTCPRTGLTFMISDYINPVKEWNIDVGLWPDGTRYETSIGLWPVAVKFYYRVKVKMK